MGAPSLDCWEYCCLLGRFIHYTWFVCATWCTQDPTCPTWNDRKLSQSGCNGRFPTISSAVVLGMTSSWGQETVQACAALCLCRPKRSSHCSICLCMCCWVCWPELRSIQSAGMGLTRLCNAWREANSWLALHASCIAVWMMQWLGRWGGLVCLLRLADGCDWLSGFVVGEVVHCCKNYDFRSWAVSAEDKESFQSWITCCVNLK